MNEGAGTKAAGKSWGDGTITLSQAREFAADVGGSASEQEAIAHNLSVFPVEVKVRGLFFDGMQRAVANARGDEAMKRLQRRAGSPEQLIAFGHYPHRDFYKVYYLAARLIHPDKPMSQGLRLVARTFFPVFKTSLVGRTMSALMGEKPQSILPALAKAYNISVENNTHECRLEGERTAHWQCSVEPVEWYEDTFRGIVEGTMPAAVKDSVHVSAISRRLESHGRLVRCRFRIQW